MARREKHPVETEPTPETLAASRPREAGVWTFLEKLLVMPEIRTFYLYGPPGFATGGLLVAVTCSAKLPGVLASPSETVIVTA